MSRDFMTCMATDTPPTRIRQNGFAIRGFRLRKLIEVHGELVPMSQTELARRVGVDKGVICRVEAEDRDAHRPLLLKIARELGVRPQALARDYWVLETETAA